VSSVLETIDVTKRFGAVTANDRICLSLDEGEIHALLGENGAGKTTLMSILYGLHRPDRGEVRVKGSPVAFDSPRDAIRVGIGMVHQHFMLADALTVAENVMAGEEALRFGVLLDRQAAAERIASVSVRHGLEVSPTDIVRDLAVGVQQRVEIIKLLYRDARILILDEPTASLTPQEVSGLFQILRSLVAEGKSVLLATHKLSEVLDLADRVTVLRAGQAVATTRTSEVSEHDLACLMVGREVSLRIEKRPADPGHAVLRVSDLSVLDDRKHLAVKQVSFDVRAGEILGVAGVQGNGQTQLAEAIVGLRPISDGQVWLGGVQLAGSTPRRVAELGVGYIPEDRRRDGLVLASDVATNLILNTYYLPPFAARRVLNEEAIRTEARRRIQQFDIRTTGPGAPVSSLSGGNQQKVIMARELSRPLALLVASQPTRGLDIGSVEYVHRQIIVKRDRGAAVLLFSTELDEILGLADRIAVMFRGEVVAVLDSGDSSKEKLGLLMAGGNTTNLPSAIPARAE
jgi:ABC-type uncharacterized transport system ATPase subunit